MAVPAGFELVTKPSVVPAGFELVSQGGVQDAAPSGVTSAAPNAQIQPSANAQGLASPADSGGGVGDVLGGLSNAALEIMAGVNRGAISMADIPADIANAILQLSGSDVRAPTIGGTEFGQQATAGGFVEDPTARQALGMVGEFAAPAPPIAALARRGDDIPRIAEDFTSLFTTPSPAKQKIAQKIAEDPANKNLVKFIRDGAGGVQKDKLALDAIKQGFDEGVLAAVKGSRPKDRQAMGKMVNIVKRGRENALFAAKNRPTDVAGETLLKRVNQVKRANREAGGAIDKVAGTLKGKSLDINAPITKFADQMDEFGIGLAPDGKGGFKPDFTNSALAPGDRGPIKEVIRQMSRLGRGKQPDAFDAHQMKRIIDRNVTFGKTKTGLSGEAERALKEFRVGIDDALDSKFTAYNRANTQYSETINALDSLQSAAGTKLDLFGDNADKAIGTSLRRLLSNTQSRVNMIDAIDELDAVAKSTEKGLGLRIGKAGETAFDDDIMTQVLFADELDSMFGAAARTSLKGQQQQIERGVDAASRAAQAPSRGVFEFGVDVAKTGVEKARGINEENAIKSIEKLLRR